MPNQSGTSRRRGYLAAVVAVLAVVALAVGQAVFDWGAQVNPAAPQALFDVQMMDTSAAGTGPIYGWAGGDSVMLRTIDGGRTWTQGTFALELGAADTINGLFFLTVDSGWAATGGFDATVGDSGRVLSTINGGASWTSIFDTTIQFSSVYFVDNNIGFLAGRDTARVWKSTDAGLTWQVLLDTGVFDINSGLEEIIFIDANIGIAVGDTANGGAPLVLETADAGATWTKAILPASLTAGLSDIDVTLTPGSDTTFWIGSKADAVLKRVGLTGAFVNTNSSGGQWTAVSGIDSSNAWFAQNSNIYNTTDGGITVPFQNIFSDGAFRTGLWALDTNLVWAVSDSGDINKFDKLQQFGDSDASDSLEATDAALVLKAVVRKFTPDSLQNLRMDVSGNGELRAFDASLILRRIAGLISTFPAGSTFFAKPAALDGQVVDLQARVERQTLTVSVYLSGAQPVYAAEMTMTYDPAVFEYLRATPTDLTSNFLLVARDWAHGEVTVAMAAVDPLREDGALVQLQFRMRADAPPGAQVAVTSLHLNETQVLGGAAASVLSAVPLTYALAQNYPNPFNPSTTVRYQVADAAHVRLSVYNLLGQAVVTLVDGSREAGAHAIVWDGRNRNGLSVAAGVYLLRMQANDFTATRKMLLLK